MAIGNIRNSNKDEKVLLVPVPEGGQLSAPLTPSGLFPRKSHFSVEGGCISKREKVYTNFKDYIGVK